MAFDTFKLNMTSFFLQTKGTTSAIPTIEQEDPNNPGTKIEVLNIDAELTKIARKIADEYHLTTITARQQSGGTFRSINVAVHSSTMEAAKEGIFLAILAVLKAMHKDGIKPSISLMLPIGLAVVSYWSTTLTPGSFLPTPPPLSPPVIAPVPGVLVNFPGNPRPIAKGFKDAFSKYDGEQDFDAALSKMLDDMINGFQNHLDTISGIYVGLVPAGLITIPVSSPWKGIKL
jgi:hypothetical protein